jgi:hypothetical protein
MGDWVPEKQIEVEGHGIYLWRIPPTPPRGPVRWQPSCPAAFGGHGEHQALE